MLTRIVRTLRALRGDDRGFTMVTVVSSMMVLGLLAVGAYAASTGDMPTARKDQDRKQAYEAAQAGVDWYQYKLRNDQDYWKKCADSSNPNAPITLEGQAVRGWRAVVAGTESDPKAAKFRIEILKGGPNADQLCQTSNPSRTALVKSVLRIRVIGMANGQTRTIGTAFQYNSDFLRYVYFSNWETMDPLATGITQMYTDSRNVCDHTRTIRNKYSCVKIQFGGGDAIRGSMHTNDESVYACDSVFGRDSNDVFEVTGPSPGNAAGGSGYSCSGSPTYKATKRFNSPTLAMPPGNGELRTLATPAWTFSGQTCLVFRGNLLDIYRQNAHQPWSATNYINCSDAATTAKRETRDLSSNPPPNGVIYVANSGSCSQNSYSTEGRTSYKNQVTCGDVAIRGSYGQSLTIGAENDIIINGNLDRAGSDQLFGMIANNFVRVYHPITGDPQSNGCSATSASPTYDRVNTITASVMSLNHSVQVDNYGCGAGLGTLTLTGSMIQYYRGTVGTNSGDTGYVKDYNYDELLKGDQPPNFLAPANSDNVWKIARRTDITKGV